MKLHHKLATTLFLLAAGLPGHAQQAHPEFPAVKLVIDQFFDSINTNNGALLADLEVEGAQILNVREDVAGQYDFVERQWFDDDNFDASTRLTERYWNEQLLISDHLAVFWAPYDFHINGTFSHCGIDVLNLIKIDGQWKIGHAMWTIQRPDCEDSPLGPLN